MHLDKDAWYSLIGVGAICWTLGGAGPKWIRRFLWPVVIGVSSIIGGLAVLPSIVASALTAIINSLGYGDRTTEVVRHTVFFLLALVLIPLGANGSWVVGSYLLIELLWRLTNDGYVPHKLFEAVTGAVQGALVANAIVR